MPIQHAYLNYDSEQSSIKQPKQWYETIWGLVILTVGLNVFSNFLYEKSRDRLFNLDKRRQRLKDINFLEKYENRSKKQAEQEVDTEERLVNEEIAQ